MTTTDVAPKATSLPVATRVDRLAWPALAGELDDVGVALTSLLLSVAECRSLAGLYDDDGLFRSTIDMARHRFGEGQYRYFGHPLPGLVAELRAAFWPHLLPVAREWAGRRGQPAPWPDDLEDWLGLCREAGQARPTPLMLRYGPGDWNALHRDLYGELVFPLQVVLGLDEPGVDYTGGEFVVVEQRPRAQSRATSSVIGQGQGLVFTTRDRPVRTKRGWANSPMRHSVSVVRSGQRRTLGLVFHDAT
ncbi:MAG: proline hydroxylase [Acidimicrobiia bacterium]|nr:proline hydroxylase [Acidimicrobiia bacterium]